MSYASIMVAVDPGLHAPARIRLAAAVAQRFGARLVGLAACEPDYPQGFGETIVPAGFGIEDIRKAALDHLTAAEETFRQASSLNDRVEWRSGLAHPVRFLAEQSRAADLVVIGRRGNDEGPDHGMSVDPGDALMGLGCPVLVAPAGVGHLEARQIAIGWKNTPQTRRAIRDAMPLLKRAETVRIVTVAGGAENDEVEDVAAYLALHDVQAVPVRRRTSGGSVAAELQEAANGFGADLIVTGAYGHARLREWAFGGVTRSLLGICPTSCLMSH